MTHARLAQPWGQRVGLLGGTFDPPHLAHLALAQCALSHLQLDRVLWLPAGQPWQKADRHITPAHHRCAMVRLLMQGESRFELDEREIRRSGPSTTIQTVQELVAEHPHTRWYLILGQDQFARLDTWRQWQDLVRRVVLAVAPREGQPMQAAQAMQALAAHDPTAWTAEELPLVRHPVSSSAVRAQCQSGADVSALVGPAVARYIDEHRLYSGTP